MALRSLTLVLLALAVPQIAAAQANRPATATPYYPGAVWQHKTPTESGLDAARLKEATDFAIANESHNPRDLVLNHYQTFGREPFGYAIGPIKDRGDPTGIIIHHGYIVAEWGEPGRVDMAHSITKSMLSSVVGVAYDRGLIRSINDKVGDYVPPVQIYNPQPSPNKSDRLGAPDLLTLFDTPHNRTITWNHMLRQTSDWEGTLWGKPDWADRPEPNAAAWGTRPRHIPGTVYKYNDTRVNAMALAALNVWRRRCRRCSKRPSWTRSAPPTPGAGTATRIPGSCSTAPSCNRSPAAAIGAAGCSSMPTTWGGSAISPCATANGTTAS